MHPDLAQFARKQGGAFTQQQARQYHGWWHLSRLRDAGVIDDLGAARLAIPHPPDDVSSRLLRAQIVTAHPLIACHSTATALAGFGVVDDGSLHATTPDARWVSTPPEVVLHQMALRSPPVIIGGVLATDPADAAVDTACSASDIDVLPVLDAYLRRFWTDDTAALDLLAAAVLRAKGQRGLQRVRHWARFADPRAESPMESRTRARFIAAGLPPPDLQIEVSTGAGHRYLDMGWRDRRVGTDFEGEEFHTGDGAMQRDRHRHNDITDQTWTMFYPTARDVYYGHQNLVAMVRRALNRSGPALPTVARTTARAPAPTTGTASATTGPPSATTGPATAATGPATAATGPTSAATGPTTWPANATAATGPTTWPANATAATAPPTPPTSARTTAPIPRPPAGWLPRRRLDSAPPSPAPRR